jgi:hypothetical protein
MKCHDPLLPAFGSAAISEKEWTVDEIAQLTVVSFSDKNAITSTVGSAPAEGGQNLSPSPESGVAARVAAYDVEVPTPLTPAPKRPASGRYRGVSGNLQLELRVDVDGRRPTRRVSGDLFRVAGGTTSYFGSFIIHTPTITATPTTVIIKGSGQFSFITLHEIVTVTIPRVAPLAPPAAAQVVFTDNAGGAGAVYTCPFVSPFFRTVQYEQDSVQGTVPFISYNTGQLSSGGPARALSVVSAYAEAGIEVQVAGVSNIIPTDGSGPDAKWSNAELHASMAQQFSLWRNDPQWKVWLLIATRHENAGLRGIMFDQEGRQRQGCAVFHDLIQGDTALAQRAALRTYIHELGHCFNLLHSWQKTLAVPPQPNKLDALSWMNYVQNFPGGEAAYWAAFPFQFEDSELVHLRHAFRDNVIMGGNNFGAGAAEFDAQAFAEPLVDNSGLKLELKARKNFVQCEPVVVELKLSTTDLRGKRVHTRIHPNFGFVQLAIQLPNGQTAPYRPLAEQCAETETIVLDAENPAIYASAYISYGKKGFYFDQAGLYQLRAVYYALDGSEVVSNTLMLRVRSPLDRTEERIADLYAGNDQGALFFLLGSDSEYLASGNKDLETVVGEHGDHPLAVYAHLVQGINAARQFKTVTDDKQLKLRKPQDKEAIEKLSEVVNASKQGAGVDNITLDMTMRRLARAQHRYGDDTAANATINDITDFFGKQLRHRPQVARKIAERANELKTELLGDGAVAKEPADAKKGGRSSRKSE